MRLDPQIAAVLAEDAASGVPPSWQLTPSEARAANDLQDPARWGRLAPVEAVVELEAAGAEASVPLTLFRPVGVEAPAPALLLVHGGGWVLGGIRTHEPLCRAIAEAARAVVVSPEYRLAPEHPFPAAVEDVLTALFWLAREAGSLGVDPARLSIGGDSAGGNLAAVAARHARDGGIGLACQLLLWPVLDPSRESESYELFAEGYGLSREDMRWFIGHYLEPSQRRHPDAAPLLAPDLAGVAPAIVVTAEYDVLRDEGEAYARRLEQAGVPTVLRREPGMTHGFLGYLGVVDHARAALPEIAGLLRERLDAARR